MQNDIYWLVGFQSRNIKLGIKTDKRKNVLIFNEYMQT